MRLVVLVRVGAVVRVGLVVRAGVLVVVVGVTVVGILRLLRPDLRVPDERTPALRTFDGLFIWK